MRYRTSTISDAYWIHTTQLYDPDTHNPVGARSCVHCSEDGHEHLFKFEMHPHTHRITDESRTKVATEEVVPHLCEKHGYSVCDICGGVLKTAGLRQHKKSYSCTMMFRKSEMIARGFQEATGDLRVYLNSVKGLGDKLIEAEEWDSEAFGLIHAQVVAHRQRLRQCLGAREARTKYVTGQGWATEFWVSEDVRYFLHKCHALRTKKSFDDVYQLVWQYAEADEVQREAILGGIELALEV